MCESSLLSRTQPHVPVSSNVYFSSPSSDGAEKAFVMAANTRSDVTTRYPWPAIAKQAVSGYWFIWLQKALQLPRCTAKVHGHNMAFLFNLGVFFKE